MLNKFVIIYSTDEVVHNNSAAEHLEDLKKVFLRLEEIGLIDIQHQDTR